MGQVIRFQKNDWLDLLQLKWLRDHSATEHHLKYFISMYKQKKREFIESSSGY